MFLQQVYPCKRYQQQLYIHTTEFMSILFTKNYCVLLTRVINNMTCSNTYTYRSDPRTPEVIVHEFGRINV